MHELWLKPGKERSLARRHPWIYATAVARVAGKPDAGDLVAVHGADGRWLAWAAFAPDSAIRARCWSFTQEDRIDRQWLAARVREAVARRSTLAEDSNALRLVYGEADLLPGLIADRYERQLVVQLQAPGVQAQSEVLLEALCEASGCSDVFDRSDSALRQREGMAVRSGVLRGQEPAERIEVHEHGLSYRVDVRRGHKTGFYIDQRDNRRLARELATELARTLGRAPRGLNAFCYTGAFSIAMASGGASGVVSIDSSAEALSTGRSQVELNRLDPDSIQWRCSDVFEELRACRDAGERFDLIVLDPPKFAASHHHVERAARAYKDINLNALRLLNPGGLLMTFSCSGAIDTDLFQKIVAGAVFDAQADCVMRARLGPGADHPMLMTHPEGEYLKGLLLQRL
ncbi:MAG TPA: class I SAM-dependent rRNA methyltransferase [Burkholderiaceae bacterium]|nr:class I SAM-dependent rRNA methyltransferase [Burkholderiaceae bacterium]